MSMAGEIKDIGILGILGFGAIMVYQFLKSGENLFNIQIENPLYVGDFWQKETSDRSGIYIDPIVTQSDSSWLIDWDSTIWNFLTDGGMGNVGAR